MADPTKTTLGTPPIDSLVFHVGPHATDRVVVETPYPLSRELWSRLKRYVDLLEPSDPPSAKSGPVRRAGEESR